MCVYKYILVVCEGGSEERYIKVLKKFFREYTDKQIVTIVSSNLRGGITVSNYISRIKDALKSAGGDFDELCIWLDVDLFKRKYNNLSLEEIKEMCQQEINRALVNLPRGLRVANLPVKLCFNYMNGEDFLSMCHGGDVVMLWQDFCEKNNHFINPMVAAFYKGEADRIIPCKTGDECWLDFQNIENIKNLISCNENLDIKFSSDFVDFISKLVDETI